MAASASSTHRIEDRRGGMGFNLGEERPVDRESDRLCVLGK